MNKIKKCDPVSIQKAEIVHVFLDILSRGAAEVSDARAFHVVERCCCDFLLSEV